MAILAIVTGFVFAIYFIFSLLGSVSRGIDNGWEVLEAMFKVVGFTWFVVMVTLGFIRC